MRQRMVAVFSMVLGVILLAAIVYSIIGFVTHHERWYNSFAWPLYMIALTFFVVTIFTSYLYSTETFQPIGHIQLVDDRVYYTDQAGTLDYVNLNSTTFKLNTLTLGEGVLIKNCTANPLWLSVPLTNCRWVVYAGSIPIGPTK
jgi:hypothetical protein